MAVAVIAYFVLPDFPHNTAFLTPLERKLAEHRLLEDVGEPDTEERGSSMRGLKNAMLDWKVWWMAFALTAMVVGLSFNQYFPTLTRTLGFNTTVTLLLCAPPWAFACLCSFVNARHSDKTGERFFHIIAPLVIGMIGFIIPLGTRNVAARYIAL
jgi:hypothetical protein